MTTKTAKFTFLKETTGAYRYEEVNEAGMELKAAGLMGSLYLRKHAIGARAPATLTVVVEYEA